MRLNQVLTYFQYGIEFGVKKGFLRVGDPIVCITGWRKGAGSSNTVRIVYVDDKTLFGDNSNGNAEA